MFNKDLDWNIPMLIGGGIFLLLFSNIVEASTHTQIRTEIVDVLNVDDISTQECLVYNLYHESRSESDMANIMVLNSVFNRVQSPHYPDNACDVVKQKWQYSWTFDGRSDRMYDIKQVVRLENIVEHYLLNKQTFLSMSGGVDHYHTTSISPQWSVSPRMVKIATIDNHVFYKRK